MGTVASNHETCLRRLVNPRSLGNQSRLVGPCVGTGVPEAFGVGEKKARNVGRWWQAAGALLETGIGLFRKAGGSQRAAKGFMGHVTRDTNERPDNGARWCLERYHEIPLHPGDVRPSCWHLGGGYRVEEHGATSACDNGRNPRVDMGHRGLDTTRATGFEG